MMHKLKLARKPKYPPKIQTTTRASAIDLARQLSRGRKPEPHGEEPAEQGDEEIARQFSQKKRDIARGKKPMELVDEDIGSGSEDEEAIAPRNLTRQPTKKPKGKPSEGEILEALMSMRFTGTRYPHRETMERLGILRDVEFLFEMCNLSTFMSYQFEGYKLETCQFLASLTVHFYDDQSEEGMGYINFTIRDREYHLTIKQIDTLFEFRGGVNTCQDLDKEELQAVWETIAGGFYSSSRSKSSKIRSPVLRYMHKAIANTLFARVLTGPINEGELKMIDIALKGTLVNTKNGGTLEGDRSDTGITLVLLGQLLYYKEWAMRLHHMGIKGELTVGGIVTPILHACGVDLESVPTAFKWIDVQHLTKTKFLDREKPNGRALYKFTHSELGEAKMILPNVKLTKIRLGENIDFNPPAEELFIPQDITEQTHEEPFDEEALEEPEGYYFEDRPSTLKEANRRIGLLQKWSKWQDKTIKALKDTVRNMASSMKEMSGQIKELQGKVTGTSSKPGIKGLSKLGRSGSFTMAPRRNVPTDVINPPRASSFETRDKDKGQGICYTRNKRRRAAQTPSSTSKLGQEFEPRTSSSSRLDFDIEPTNVEPYTKESMDEHVSTFFTPL